MSYQSQMKEVRLQLGRQGLSATKANGGHFDKLSLEDRQRIGDLVSQSERELKAKIFTEIFGDERNASGVPAVYDRLSDHTATEEETTAFHIFSASTGMLVAWRDLVWAALANDDTAKDEEGFVESRDHHIWHAKKEANQVFDLIAADVTYGMIAADAAFKMDDQDHLAAKAALDAPPAA
jgi:hypothetical protein